MTSLQHERHCRNLDLPALRAELRFWHGQVLVRTRGWDRGAASDRRNIVWHELVQRLGRDEATRVYLAEGANARRERRGLPVEGETA